MTIPHRRPMSRERVSDEHAERVLRWMARERLWDELIDSACPDFVPDLEKLVEDECFACTLGLDGQIGAR